MLIRRPHLEGIVGGTITLAFRRWKRPTVRSGGTLRTFLGVLAIEDVRVVKESEIGKADARRAGFESRAALINELGRRTQGKLYRIELRFAGLDPRVELRERGAMTAEEAAVVKQKLARSDAASKRGPWSEQTLRLIADNPGTRAADLAAKGGFEKTWFKAKVRRLKELGLTESLETGYRLSSRGRAYFEDRSEADEMPTEDPTPKGEAAVRRSP